jgi:hypothetical protein
MIKISFFFLLLFISGCGKGGSQECSIPSKSFTDCCSEHSGFNYCSSTSQNSILFQDGHVVCYDNFVTTTVACQK